MCSFWLKESRTMQRSGHADAGEVCVEYVENPRVLHVSHPDSSTTMKTSLAYTKCPRLSISNGFATHPHGNTGLDNSSKSFGFMRRSLRGVGHTLSLTEIQFVM